MDASAGSSWFFFSVARSSQQVLTPPPHLCVCESDRSEFHGPFKSGAPSQIPTPSAPPGLPRPSRTAVVGVQNNTQTPPTAPKISSIALPRAARPRSDTGLHHGGGGEWGVCDEPTRGLGGMSLAPPPQFPLPEPPAPKGASGQQLVGGGPPRPKPGGRPPPPPPLVDFICAQASWLSALLRPVPVA